MTAGSVGSIRTEQCGQPARNLPSPLLLIVAGPNGSGKTTLVRQGVLAAHLDVPLGSINPDDVARDLAGGGAPTADISLRAAQICDGRRDDEIEAGRSV